MKLPLLFTLIFTFLSIASFSQEISDFEDLNPGPDAFNNGAGADGRFDAGNIWLPNDYNAEFDAWNGWAISSKTDTSTAGFFNQYSAIPGHGANSSATYAVGYAFDPIIMHVQDAVSPAEVTSLYVTNNTYPYLSMRDGDAFSKKFGGVSGEDPDFFLLTIKAFHSGILSSDSVDFYLADFRPDSNESDYIINDWTQVDVSAFGEVDSLQFSLSSSDVGAFGMNTPAYFSIDQISTQPATTSSDQFSLTGITIYPNPTVDRVYIDNNTTELLERISLLNVNGQIIWQHPGPTESIDMKNFLSGTYFLQLKRRDGDKTMMIIKK